MKYLKLCKKKKMTDNSCEDMTTAIHCTIFYQTVNYKKLKTSKSSDSAKWITFLKRNSSPPQYGKTINSLSLKKFSSNQLFSNFFSKSMRENFCNFNSVSPIHFFHKNSVKSTHSLLNYLLRCFHEKFFKWEWISRFSSLCHDKFQIFFW